MSNADALKGEFAHIRQRTLTSLTALKEKTSWFELPKLPNSLEQYQQRLGTNAYNVLVVGEAKRGKTSFVNALIGSDLLPTDVEIATSQVFRVSQAKQGAYRLRFEDETTQEIIPSELFDYGSQVAADQGLSQVKLDKLRWIEVDIPVRFLPEGVSILDTPGLGSLYSAHLLVTQRFVPLADGVIFVLDSGSPMGQLELEFIESILGITRHIFFIQTKIDQYDKEDWQRIQQRNEAILESHFKDRLTDTRVWPISSRNLMKAAQSNNPSALLKVSRQQELAEALEIFLFRVAGINRCSDALLIADQTFVNSRRILVGRLAALTAKSTQELTDLHTLSAQRRQQFEADWGLHGKKRQELLAKAQKAALTHKRSMMDLLASGGPFEKAQREKIDAVQSLEAANQLGAKLSEEIVTNATKKWREVTEEARLQCSVLLGSFIEGTNELLLSADDPNLPIRIGTAVNVRDDLKSKLQEAQDVFWRGGQIAWIGAGVLALFVPIAVPVALLGASLVGIFVAMRNWKNAQLTEIEHVRQQLHDYLTDIMQEMRVHFLQSNLEYDGQSLVNHYFDSLVRLTQGQIEELYEEKLEEARRESTRLDEQIKLGAQQRIAKKEKTEQQLVEWDDLGRSIRNINVDLKILEANLTESDSQ